MNYTELKIEADSWINSLVDSGKSENTIKQYKKSLEWFFKYLEENEIEEIGLRTVNQYKASMEAEIEKNQQNPPRPPKGKSWRTERPLTKYSTANIRLKAVNALFRALDRKDLIVDNFNDSTSNINNDVLNDLEYLRLLDFTKSEKVKLIIETLVHTGARISELRNLTVESLKKRHYTINNKGRIREVFIPKGLARKLKAYCRDNGIKSGIIFRGQPIKDESGKPIIDNGRYVYKMISQSYIRDEMKRSAGRARMQKSKAYPHSLRHLFAKHYSAMPDSDYYILPELLGHSTANVTGVYTKQDEAEMLRIIDDLEAFTNKRLKETQKIRDKNKKLADAKKKKNQKKGAKK